MKRVISLLVFIMISSSVFDHADAQLLKKLKNEVKHRVENHLINDAGNVTDKSVTKTENTISNAAKNHNNNEDYSQDTREHQDQPAPSEGAAVVPAPVGPVVPPVTVASYKNYDFVQGDQIIFETAFKNQQDAELPARLETLHGNAEIQTYKGNKVLHISKGSNVCIMPLIDSFSYLPDQFTVEFYFMYQAPDPTSYNQIEVDFYKPGREDNDVISNYGDYHFMIYEADQIDFGKSMQGVSLATPVINDLKVPGKWHHVAVYIHNNIGKAYIDQYRVAASNTMLKGAGKLAIKTNGRMDYLIRNLRIAGGGTDAYHKVITDGKLITHGIHFASGKSEILPESMGTMNEVYALLKDHPDLKFEIDGYTDNDGSADLNLKLSKERAAAVKKELTKMGIDASRLTTNGFGEQDPIAKNDTPEGKANNRRVEFVKK